MSFKKLFKDKGYELIETEDNESFVAFNKNFCFFVSAPVYGTVMAAQFWKDDMERLIKSFQDQKGYDRYGIKDFGHFAYTSVVNNRNGKFPHSMWYNHDFSWWEVESHLTPK